MKGLLRELLIFLRGNYKLVVIAIVLVWVYRIFFGKDSYFGKREDAPLAGTELKKDLSISKVTIDKSLAVAIANSFYDATANFSQWGFPATDEDAIYDGLSKLKTQDDFNLVYKEFGLRPYSKDFGNASGIVEHPLDLIEILSYELNDNEKAYIRENFSHLTIF